MRLEAIQKILRHCYERQEASGPESAFRFANVSGPKNTRVQASYPDDGPSQISAKAKGKQKAKQIDQLDGLLPISESVRVTPDPGTLGLNVVPEHNTGGFLHSNYGAYLALSQSIAQLDQLSGHDWVTVNMDQMVQLR